LVDIARRAFRISDIEILAGSKDPAYILAGLKSCATEGDGGGASAVWELGVA
jgi:hypothetical protein